MLTAKQKKTLAYITAGFAFLILSFYLDGAVLEFANHIQMPFLEYIFSWMSSLLSLFIVLLAMASLFMWEENKKDWILPLWFSCLAATLLSIALKAIVARERPDEIYTWVLSYSFPSSHAAFAFAAVPILDEEFRRLKWFWILFAVLVAVSRLYLGYHYLSDVIAGALLGALIGIAMVYIKRKYSILG